MQGGLLFLPPSLLACSSFRFYQRSGAKNALGRVTFVFPNVHHVYLHDTSSRALFDRAERARSHGCVRVEKPLEPATRLLQDPQGPARQRALEYCSKVQYDMR
jgi:murein L,D-transpeptidase YcbB/YkuD